MSADVDDGGSAPVLRCQGCGREIPGDSPTPFRCPSAGHDGGDHVLGRPLRAVSFPLAGSPNPFLRYRALTHAHALATARGMGDAAFVALVSDLDAAVARVCGRGFVETPFQESASLAEAIGARVWVKDETGNVSGSHKGRHLMGLAILGEVHQRTGIATGTGARLAIASCGNAALAAAVIARAWRRDLDVFIPEGANPRTVADLARLGATIHVCPRAGGMAGDPCYHAFREAVAAGATPFCCQGSDHGLTVEGGETLAWEMAGELSRKRRSLDRLFVQVGGGALASACVQGLREATALGASVSMPRIHPVQTRGAAPLRRAWERVTARIAMRLGLDVQEGDSAIAEKLRAAAGSPVIEEQLQYAGAHRAEFMWPWETEPRSVATGILDDETYDWLAVVRGTIESGGFPVVVGEERLTAAHALGRERTGIDVDPTGTAGLAGLCELRESEAMAEGEVVGVIFSGAQR